MDDQARVYASVYEDESIAAVEQGDIEHALMIAQQGWLVSNIVLIITPTTTDCCYF